MNGQTRASVNDTFLSHDIIVPTGSADPLIFFRVSADEISDTLRRGLRLHGNIRFSIGVEITFERFSENGRAWIESRFSTMMHTLTNEYGIDEALDLAINQLMERISSFTELGLGWNILSVDRCEVKMAPYNAIRGSGPRVATPSYIAAKKATRVNLMLLVQEFYLDASGKEVPMPRIRRYVFKSFDEAWWPSGLSRLVSIPASASVGSNPADRRP
jgi:hypothetical protein